MKRIFFFAIATMLFLPLLLNVNAQMMGWGSNQNPPSQSDLQDEENMQNQGLAIYKNLKNGKITCQKLTNNDYEKLGEYYMGQVAGSTQNHVYWDQRIQQMMGEQGDTQMHIVWGERGSGCLARGGFGMIGFGAWNNMMGSWGVLGGLTWLLVVVFLILGIVYFWKGISKPHGK